MRKLKKGVHNYDINNIFRSRENRRGAPDRRIIYEQEVKIQLTRHIAFQTLERVIIRIRRALSFPVIDKNDLFP